MITLALKTFWQEEDGQDLVEYSLLLAFIALAAVAILSGVKGQITALWTSINNALTDAVTSAS
jgi:Flp pilus assembly pilin Flp